MGMTEQKFKLKTIVVYNGRTYRIACVSVDGDNDYFYDLGAYSDIDIILHCRVPENELEPGA